MAAGMLVALYAAVFVVAFLLGSIPCGVLVGKFFFGIDPRSGGSGSIGATNSSRMLGAKGGAMVLVFDMLKGVIAVGIARIAVVLTGIGSMGEQAAWMADLLIIGSTFLVIAGHIYSPWLGFKGGKGISTGFGSLLVASPAIALGIAVVFAIFAVATRIVSVGSMCAAASVFFFALATHWGSVPFAVFSALISLMVIYAHRANIKRLLNHEEPKFSLKKSSGKE